MYLDSRVVMAGALALCLLWAAGGAAQSTPVTPQTSAHAVIRLRVRPKIEGEEKVLARKRFFLIKGSLEENQAFVESLARRPLLPRECYYRSVGASEALIRWMKKNECESVYCREIEPQDTEGGLAVPEFQAALARGAKDFRNVELARKWITVNLREDIRSGFYRRQQEVLRGLIKQAEEVSKTKVTSVMTDGKGTAYFTDLAPGTYVISNIMPTEVGSNSILWNCEVRVRAEDLGVVKPWLISNQKGGGVKCVGVENPLPACVDANK